MGVGKGEILQSRSHEQEITPSLDLALHWRGSFYEKSTNCLEKSRDLPLPSVPKINYKIICNLSISGLFY